MPAKIRSGRVLQPARQSAEAGTTGRAPVRRRRGAAAGAVALSLGRLHSVRFEPKAGFYVYNRLKTTYRDEISLERIYKDLFACYERYYFLTYGKYPAFTPLDISSTLDSAVQNLFRLFKMIIEPYQFNIDRADDGSFHFVIYQQCDWSEQLELIEVGKAIEIVNRKSKGLLHVFLTFISEFAKTQAETWFNGYFSEYINWFLVEELNESGDEMEEDERLEYEKAIKLYNHGNPNKYARLINKCEPQTPEQIQQQLKKYRSCPEIITIIDEGCELLKENRKLGDFNYNPFEGNDQGYGLQFDSQAALIWDVNDLVFDKFEDHINIEAQEGHYLPYCSLVVDPRCSELFQTTDWPNRLAKYMTRAQGLINTFKKNNTKR